MEYVRIILNNALYLSLLVILVSSVIGVFVAGRKRDRCLKDFNGDECRLMLTSGKSVYGVFHAYGSGIELEYTRPHVDRQGHLESSFMLYSVELSQIAAIKRFHLDLSAQNRRTRTREITRTYQPSIFRIMQRRFRNFVNTFQDGLNRSLTALIGAAATRNPQSKVAGREKELTGLGNQMIGVVSHAYDAILEKYIGHYVVLEMPVNGEIQEFCGILKDYTQNYIEILNLMEPKIIELNADQSMESRDVAGLEIHRHETGFEIINRSDWPLYLDWLEVREQRIPVGRFLNHGDGHISEMPDDTSTEPDASLQTEVRCGMIVPEILDVIVPRTLGIVRHGCPRARHNLDTFLGLSTSKTVQEALFRQFEAGVNAKISSDPDENGHPG
ncbi:MAG TPA: hypothetical protein PLV45_02555 [bacterium]|nr:hypothetical protein [bacterium]